MLISLTEYAARHQVDSSVVRRKAIAGTLPAFKIGRNWCIDEDAPYIDLRVKSGKYKNWRKKKEEA